MLESEGEPPERLPVPGPDAADLTGSSRNRLRARIEESFRDVYLTLISIIQGTVLGYFAQVAGGLSPPHTLGLQVRMLIVFLTVITVWHEYMIGATAFAWAPTLLDSILPFGLAVVEYLQVNSLNYGERGYLVVQVVFWLAASISYANYWGHARYGKSFQNRDSWRLLHRHVTSGLLSSLAALVYSLLLLVFLDTGRLTSHRVTGGGLAIASLVPYVVILVRGIPDWQDASHGGRTVVAPQEDDLVTK